MVALVVVFEALLVFEDKHGTNNKERMRMNKIGGGCDFGIEFIVMCVLVCNG